MREASEKKQSTSSSGVYKCQFLKDKLEFQNQSRRGVKGAKKEAAVKQETEVKKTAAGPKKNQENEEALYTIIEELKSDLEVRDREFEAMRKRVDMLTEQNSYLKKELGAERLKSITVLSKLNKIVNLKELEANYTVIENGKFFEKKNTKATSLNANLYNSVNDQYKSSLQNSYVAKYAKRWLEVTR